MRHEPSTFITKRTVAVFASMCALATSGYANACDCSRIRPEDAFERAKLVADIKVLSLSRKSQFDFTAKAIVVRTWKGAARSSLVYVKYAQGVSCEYAPPRVGATQRIAAGSSKGFYYPNLCWSQLTWPRSEPLLNSFLGSNVQGRVN